MPENPQPVEFYDLTNARLVFDDARANGHPLLKRRPAPLPIFPVLDVLFRRAGIQYARLYLDDDW